MVNRRKSLPVLLRSYESDFRTPDIPLIVRRVAWWSAKRSLKAAANLQDNRCSWSELPGFINLA